MCLRVNFEKKYEHFLFVESLKLLKKESDPELDRDPEPDPLARGTDPRIRTKM